MGQFYEDYLKRLEKQQSQLPFTRAADITSRRLAPKFEESKGKIEDMFNREEASPLAKARFAMDEEGHVIDQLGNIYSEAQVKDIARQEQITGKMDEVQVKVDQEKEAERKAKKARTAQTWKTAAEIVGTVGGTIATGGNIAAGLAIGKAAGGVADVTTGLDKSYDLPQNIASGAGAILSGAMSTTQAVSQQGLNTFMNDNLDKISTMTGDELTVFKLGYQNAVNGGYFTTKEFINNYEKIFGAMNNVNIPLPTDMNNKATQYMPPPFGG